VSPARKGDRVAPPAEPGRWLMKFGTNDAAKGWEDLARQVPGNLYRAYEAIRAQPEPFPPTPRQHRLRGKQLSTVNGLEQWQYEVTGGGRIWYVVDPAGRTVYLTLASTKHPKATE
jgi:hypothetical protein